jgi:hypothetical protein
MNFTVNVRLFLIGAMVFGHCAFGATSTSTPFAIEKIQAFLYYSDTGEFSKDIISNQDGGLWNVIIGGGLAEGHRSDATLVKVVVQKMAMGKDDKLTLTLRSVRKGSKQVSEDVERVWFDDGQQRYIAGFWLPDTGCATVSLDAVLKSNGTVLQTIRAKIPFACGE